MAEDKNKIGFTLKKIITEQFAIIESSYKEGKTTDLKVGLKFGINFDNKIISVVFTTNFIQENSPFLVLEVSCDFNIIKDAWSNFYNESETELIIPKGFISHLAVLTIGTTRGILHSKTENTLFNTFLLPTLNVTEMVKKDIVFKVDKKSTKPTV